MHQTVQAQLRRAVVDATKFLCRYADFVAASAESHDRFRIAALGGFDHFHRRVGPELARGIEHPAESEPTAFEWLGGQEDGFEISFRLLFSEEHDADRERDLGIDHALREQMFRAVA